MEINREVLKLEYSLIRALNEESRKYSNAIDLTIGEPDIPSPKELITEALKYGAEHQLRYPPTGGGEKIRTGCGGGHGLHGPEPAAPGAEWTH